MAMQPYLQALQRARAPLVPPPSTSIPLFRTEPLPFEHHLPQPSLLI